ncbi:MAG: response regulator transcription factor [Gemmatirosa sp.]|nr:response regulator transcription factor [Gemmatirosa sp.]
MGATRVVVVEDEALARERIVTLVCATPELALVGEAAHGLQALDVIAATSPDLVFLDVEMPELDGFGVVAALLADRDSDLDDAAMPGIVFITAYEEYALRAFEVDAIDYLHKPVTPERFAAAVRRAVGRLSRDAASSTRVAQGVAQAAAALARETARHRTRFVVRRGSTHTFVAASDVVWIDAVDNYLRLHAHGRVHLVRGTMKDAERELDPAAFLRIHRSAIVNVARIAAVEALPDGGYVVRLADGARLRTSRQYAAGVRALVRVVGSRDS